MLEPVSDGTKWIDETWTNLLPTPVPPVGGEDVWVFTVISN